MNMMDLTGKRGLVVGIANEHSIAYGCASVLHKAGADLCVTYLNEKAKPYVEPLATQMDAMMLPLDVSKEGQMESVFSTLE